MKIFQIAIILILFGSCSENQAKIEKEKSSNESSNIEILKEEDVKIEETNLNELDHKFRNSDFSYKVEITNVNFKTVKNAFEITREKYAKPESMDGLKLDISFKMTNPYDKEMRVPFPSYFFITAPQFNRKNGFTYSRTYKCYIDNTRKITDSKGKPLNKFSKRKDNDYMVDFNNKETKKFKISFTDPFPKYDNLKSITFGGFNKYLKKHLKNNEFFKMKKSDREIYLADKSKIYGLEISVEDEKIISKKEFEK